MNSYQCWRCRKTVQRESDEPTIRSLCTKTGEMTTLVRLGGWPK